jgi:hypothetical protein
MYSAGDRTSITGNRPDNKRNASIFKLKSLIFRKTRIIKISIHSKKHTASQHILDKIATDEVHFYIVGFSVGYLANIRATS